MPLKLNSPQNLPRCRGSAKYASYKLRLYPGSQLKPETEKCPEAVKFVKFGLRKCNSKNMLANVREPLGLRVSMSQRSKDKGNILYFVMQGRSTDAF